MSRSIRGDGSHTFNDAITDFSVSVFVRHYVVATNSRNYRREFTASKTIRNRCRGGQLLLIGVARCTRHKAETANNNQRRGGGRGMDGIVQLCTGEFPAISQPETLSRKWLRQAVIVRLNR